jgi:hypothetical protein
MAGNVIFFAWNRPIPGREQISSAHFDDLVAYLGAQAEEGVIQGFEVVFLDSHGGDMNGFFLIRGEPANLSAMKLSEEWVEHMTRASLHLQGAGAVGGVTGDLMMGRMELWRKHALG